MSNIHSLKYLDSLEISGSNEVAGGSRELIFGGGIASMTLYERKPNIIGMRRAADRETTICRLEEQS